MSKPAKPSQSLREFIARLESAGELIRVSEPVAVKLEMTEIQTRLLAEGGPAVLFEKPVMDDGSVSPMPVLVNLFGTVERVARGVTANFAGGTPVERTKARDLREVGEALAFLRQPEPPGRGGGIHAYVTYSPRAAASGEPPARGEKKRQSRATSTTSAVASSRAT